MTYPTEQWRKKPVEEIFSSDVLKRLGRVYGDKLGEVILSLTKPSPEYYFRVNTLKTTPSVVVDRLRRAGIDVHQHPNVQEALFIPVRGPYQVSDRHVKVVVDKFTAESVLLGANVYAPGIQDCRGLRKKLEVAVTDPEGHVVGAGYAIMGEDEVLTQRKGLAVRVTETVYGLPSLRETDEFRGGLIYPQSFPAIITARILDPKPGETVLDLNCAPGGKLSHISQLMGNTGLVIGVDRSSPKVSTAKETIARLGCGNIRLVRCDARYFDLEFPDVGADRCLVDPPCSALGVTPKLYDHTTEREIQALSSYQKQFLSVASKVVKKGGVIVYSVCTVTLEECEEAAKFAVENCGLKLEGQPLIFGCPGLESACPGVNPVQRFHPHLHGNGYFIARFRKA